MLMLEVLGTYDHLISEYLAYIAPAIRLVEIHDRHLPALHDWVVGLQIRGDFVRGEVPDTYTVARDRQGINNTAVLV